MEILDNIKIFYENLFRSRESELNNTNICEYMHIDENVTQLTNKESNSLEGNI